MSIDEVRTLTWRNELAQGLLNWETCQHFSFSPCYSCIFIPSPAVFLLFLLGHSHHFVWPSTFIMTNRHTRGSVSFVCLFLTLPRMRDRLWNTIHAHNPTHDIQFQPICHHSPIQGACSQLLSEQAVSLSSCPLPSAAAMIVLQVLLVDRRHWFVSTTRWAYKNLLNFKIHGKLRYTVRLHTNSFHVIS